jgi:hypothetical protein
MERGSKTRIGEAGEVIRYMSIYSLFLYNLTNKTNNRTNKHLYAQRI